MAERFLHRHAGAHRGYRSAPLHARILPGSIDACDPVPAICDGARAPTACRPLRAVDVRRARSSLGHTLPVNVRLTKPSALRNLRLYPAGRHAAQAWTPRPRHAHHPPLGRFCCPSTFPGSNIPICGRRASSRTTARRFEAGFLRAESPRPPTCPTIRGAGRREPRHDQPRKRNVAMPDRAARLGHAARRLGARVLANRSLTPNPSTVRPPGYQTVLPQAASATLSLRFTSDARNRDDMECSYGATVRAARHPPGPSRCPRDGAARPGLLLLGRSRAATSCSTDEPHPCRRTPEHPASRARW